MVGNVSLSAGTRSSIASLAELSRQINLTQRRLATGKRVAEPIDNPAAFFTASSLNGRANSLSGLIDAMSNAEKTFSAAIAGVTAVQGLLKTAQNVVTQAAASASTAAKVTGSNSTAFTASTQIATNSGSSTRLKQGDTVTVSDGTTTATYTARNNDTIQTFLDAVNNTANLKVDASLNSSGQIELEATGSNSIVIGGSVSSSSGLTVPTGLTAGTTTGSLNAIRQSFAAQFDAIRAQIDQAVQDAGYNGTNLLGGSNLSVAFNPTGKSKLTVTGANTSSTGLGLAAAMSGSGEGFQSDSEVNAAASSLASAVATLQSLSSKFSTDNQIISTRKSFSSEMVDILKSGADDLVTADGNEESALLLALQTRQQITLTALSLTGQQDRGVLRVFGTA